MTLAKRTERGEEKEERAKANGKHTTTQQQPTNDSRRDFIGCELQNGVMLLNEYRADDRRASVYMCVCLWLCVRMSNARERMREE